MTDTEELVDAGTVAVEACVEELEDQEPRFGTLSVGVGGGAGRGPTTKKKPSINSDAELLELEEVQEFLSKLQEADLERFLIPDWHGTPAREEGEKAHKMQAAFDQSLGRVLHRIVDSPEDGVYRVDEARDHVKEMVEVLQSEGPEVVEVTPLMNFEYEGSGPIDLGVVTIRELSPREKNILGESGFLGERSPYHPLKDPQWCIAVHSSDISEGHLRMTPPTARTLLGIQLYQKETVAALTVLRYPQQWLEWYSCRYTMRPINSPTYTLEEDDEDFRDLLETVLETEISRSESLEVALRRYLFFPERETLSDELIDLVIILEALFLKREERAELKYRMALRCALFLAESDDGRAEIRESVGEAYKLRSKLVHGHGVDFDKDLVLETDRHVRSACIKYIEWIAGGGESHDAHIDRLEEEIPRRDGDSVF